MTLAAEVGALRTSAGVSRHDHVRLLRVTGDGAFDVIDRVTSAQLRVRDGQLLHTLMLTDEGHPMADVYVGRDDEEFFLLAEGPEAVELTAHIRSHVPAGADVIIEDRSSTHAILAVDGPYAWELLGAAVDPEIIGLPYLTFYHREGMTVFRAGKTGEYGYSMIVPRADSHALHARLLKAGALYDAREVSLDALDHCALENWFFNIRREGRAPVTPIELQLQWRVNYGKGFVGAEALRSRRAERPSERLTTLVADGPIGIGDAVRAEDARIGSIVNAAYSDIRGEWVALALLELRWASPGIAGLTIVGAAGEVTARTVTPPLLMNRSLSVSPQLHSYLTRHDHPAPPLVRR